MPVKLRERDIARTIGDLLELDHWRLFWLEPVSRREWGRGFGEKGMPDLLCIRYSDPPHSIMPATRAKNSEIMFIEFKTPSGTLATHQRLWHEAEHARGALTIILGTDCEASIEGFIQHYKTIGLSRGRV